MLSVQNNQFDQTEQPVVTSPALVRRYKYNREGTQDALFLLFLISDQTKSCNPVPITRLTPLNMESLDEISCFEVILDGTSLARG